MQFELFSEKKVDSFLDYLEPGSGLRYYQEACREASLKALRNNRSALVVKATGLGKTVFFSDFARGWPYDFDANPAVLVLAHREELVEQARRKLEEMTGELVEVEQGDLRASTRARIVVGSVQTVFRKARLERMGKDRFGLVIPDEAHHYVAKTYRRPLEFFESAKILGVTATPDRGDEKALGQIFDEVAFVMDILDGIEAGYLVPIRGQSVQVEQVDLSQVTESRTGHGKDLNESQLDEVMVKAVEGIVAKTLEVCPERQGVAFFPGVRSAEYAMHAFNAKKPDSAIFISGATDPDLRKAYVAGFKLGRYQYLCNCNIATEGFDAPSTSVIIMGRPTKSRALYAQMAGRGTRVLPGLVEDVPGEFGASRRRELIAGSAKPDCLLLDFVANAGKHALIGPEDLLGGEYSEEEIERAKAKRKAGREGEDTRELLRESKRELQALAESLKVQVSARLQAFDPFKVFGMEIDDKQRYAQRFGIKPATERQLNALRELGVEEPLLQDMSKSAAGQLLDKFKDRHQRGMATYKQTRQLQKYGVHAHEIPKEHAKVALDYIATQQGWGGRPKLGPVDPVRLNALCFPNRQPGED